MSYTALYRRFRPSNFEELIGQESVVKILKNQIKTGKIGHAYLFCGARGTGKTTVARIFAKAVNCTDSKDGSPCGKCAACLSLAQNTNMDVLELDAASNNTVDDIREMREKVLYPPVNVRYKVYIVDEVHMLSTAAFNALLKTLEEPPKHAVFIFATTEVQKLPATILSRCMRFDFRLVPVDKIAEYIRKIFDSIGKEYDDDAVIAIARAGEGSVRDAISVADTCSTYSDGKLTYSDVLEVLGASDNSKLVMLAANIIKSETGKALEIVEELASLGKNMSVLASDLTGIFRNILLCNTISDANSVLKLPSDAYKKYKELSDITDGRRLLRCVEIFSSLDNEFRYTYHPRIVLETALLRACSPESDYNIDALMSRINGLERKIDSLNGIISSGKVVVRSQIVEETKKAEETEIAVEDSEEVSEPDYSAKYDYSTETDIPVDDYSVPPESENDYDEPQKSEDTQSTVTENVEPNKVWGRILSTIRKQKLIALWTVLNEVYARVNDDKVITLKIGNSSEFDYLSKEDNINLLSTLAKSFGNYRVKLVQNDGNEKEQEAFCNDIEKVKKLFGEDAVELK